MASQSFSQLVNTKEVLASIQNTMTKKQSEDFKTAIITLYNTADSLKRCSPTGIIQAGLNSVKYNFHLTIIWAFVMLSPTRGTRNSRLVGEVTSNWLKGQGNISVST